MGCAVAHLAPPQLACARDDQILTDMGTFLSIHVRLYCRQTQPDQAIDPSRFRVLKQNYLLFLAMYDSVFLLTHLSGGGMRCTSFLDPHDVVYFMHYGAIKVLPLIGMNYSRRAKPRENAGDQYVGDCRRVLVFGGKGLTPFSKMVHHN